MRDGNHRNRSKPNADQHTGVAVQGMVRGKPTRTVNPGCAESSHTCGFMDGPIFAGEGVVGIAEVHGMPRWVGDGGPLADGVDERRGLA